MLRMNAELDTPNAATRAIALMGGPVAVARTLGLNSYQTVQQWMRNGVPIVYCVRVEADSGVSRRDLRPDDWHLIWPELSLTSEAATASRRDPTREPVHG